MLFNSTTFLIFVFTVWIIYVWLNRSSQNVLLVVASYIFYGWWDWRFLSLLTVTTLVSFFSAQQIERKCAKKVFLVASLGLNLGVLCFFKYFQFFVGSAQDFLNLIGMRMDVPTLKVILPVGISFYTFQAIGYIVDVYRGDQKATDDFISFSLYVSYPPQLVAGPIERSAGAVAYTRWLGGKLGRFANDSELEKAETCF